METHYQNKWDGKRTAHAYTLTGYVLEAVEETELGDFEHRIPGTLKYGYCEYPECREPGVGINHGDYVDDFFLEFTPDTPVAAEIIDAALEDKEQLLFEVDPHVCRVIFP